MSYEYLNLKDGDKWDAAAVKHLEDGIANGISSWNDLTDKPFYRETQNVDLLDGCEWSYDEDLGEWYCPCTNLPIIGETYTVIYNGTKYVLTAQDYDDGIPGLGNMNAMGLGDDTGEPFLIVFQSEECICAPLDEASEISVSILGNIEDLKKLDNMFYDGTCTYYVYDINSDSVNYLFKDIDCTVEVTRTEFGKSKNQCILVHDTFDNRIYTACYVRRLPTHGEVQIIYLTEESNSLTPRYCYTAGLPK